MRNALDPRPPSIRADLEKPCEACALHHRPALLTRIFAGAHQHECLSEIVRGHHDDAVRGRRLLNPPVDCEVARGFGGKCGPEGRHFAYSAARARR
jgi:hypothetical protein